MIKIAKRCIDSGKFFEKNKTFLGKIGKFKKIKLCTGQMPSLFKW